MQRARPASTRGTLMGRARSLSSVMRGLVSAMDAVPLSALGGGEVVVFGQVAAEGAAVGLALAEDELGLEPAGADELVGAAAADAEHVHDLGQVVEQRGVFWVSSADAASAHAVCG